MAGIGIDALLNMVGAQYDKTLIGKITNGFSDAFSSSIGQWFNDIRMRNRVGKEAYQEGQKSAWNQQTGLDLTNAQRQVMDYNAEEAQKAWERQMAYERDKYNIQTQSMTDAGLNPAMMYGGGNLVGTMANGQQASAGMPSASNGFGEMFNVMSNLAMIGAQQDLMRSQARLADAQASSIGYGIEKTKEETEGLNLENQWKQQTLDDRIEGVKLANDLTRAERNKVGMECDRIVEEINNIIADTNDKEALADLHFAQAAYARAEEREIVEMLPYKQRLAAAQTAAAAQQAAYSEMLAMKEKNLIDGGYYDALVNQAKYEETSAEVRRNMDLISDAMRQGKYYTVDPNDPAMKQAWDRLMNKFFSALKVFNDNLNPIAQAAGRVGYVGGAQTSNESTSSQQGNKTVQYY